MQEVEIKGSYIMINVRESDHTIIGGEGTHLDDPGCISQLGIVNVHHR